MSFTEIRCVLSAYLRQRSFLVLAANFRLRPAGTGFDLDSFRWLGVFVFGFAVSWAALCECGCFGRFGCDLFVLGFELVRPG